MFPGEPQLLELEEGACAGQHSRSPDIQVREVSSLSDMVFSRSCLVGYITCLQRGRLLIKTKAHQQF